MIDRLRDFLRTRGRDVGGVALFTAATFIGVSALVALRSPAPADAEVRATTALVLALIGLVGAVPLVIGTMIAIAWGGSLFLGRRTVEWRRALGGGALLILGLSFVLAPWAPGAGGWLGGLLGGVEAHMALRLISLLGGLGLSGAGVYIAFAAFPPSPDRNRLDPDDLEAIENAEAGVSPPRPIVGRRRRGASSKKKVDAAGSTPAEHGARAGSSVDTSVRPVSGSHGTETATTTGQVGLEGAVAAAAQAELWESGRAGAHLEASGATGMARPLGASAANGGQADTDALTVEAPDPSPVVRAFAPAEPEVEEELDELEGGDGEEYASAESEDEGEELAAEYEEADELEDEGDEEYASDEEEDEDDEELAAEYEEADELEDEGDEEYASDEEEDEDDEELAAEYEEADELEDEDDEEYASDEEEDEDDEELAAEHEEADELEDEDDEEYASDEEEDEDDEELAAEYEEAVEPAAADPAPAPEKPAKAPVAGIDEGPGLFDGLEDEPSPAEASEPEVSVAPAAPRATPTPPVAVAPSGAEGDRERQLFECGLMFIDEGRVAVSMLQKRFGMDFAEATGILDDLQERGLIGPYLGGKRRDILLSKEDWLAQAQVG
jgi:hypothetical protein